MAPIAHTTSSDPFEFLCATLSPCTTDDEVSELRRIAAAGGIDWPSVAEHANRADLAPALCVALQDKGLWSEVPPLFREYLLELHRFNLERNRALLQQLREVVGLLNAAGVTPLLLKGAAALVTDLYPDPGMRFMVDLDLLVPEEQLERAVAAVQGDGYAVPQKYHDVVDSPALHHYPVMIRPGSPAALELHRRVLSKTRDLLDSSSVWGNSRPYEGDHLPGLSAALMSSTDEVVYCFAHSETTHDNHQYERIDARNLLQFASLVCRYRAGIDLQRLETLKLDPRYGHLWECYLYQARKLFHVELPLSEGLGADAESHYLRATSCLGWWDRVLRRMRIAFRLVMMPLSQERLLVHYPDQNVSIGRLRIRRLRYLIGKYRRPGAWDVILMRLRR